MDNSNITFKFPHICIALLDNILPVIGYNKVNISAYLWGYVVGSCRCNSPEVTALYAGMYNIEHETKKWIFHNILNEKHIDIIDQLSTVDYCIMPYVENLYYKNNLKAANDAILISQGFLNKTLLPESIIVYYLFNKDIENIIEKKFYGENS